jgi:3-phosphoshikimate 1-carboxyvinyltransferase
MNRPLHSVEHRTVGPWSSTASSCKGDGDIIRRHVVLPGSKSLSLRYVVQAAFAEGRSVLRNFGFGDDGRVILEGIKEFGANVKGQEEGGISHVVIDGDGLLAARTTKVTSSRVVHLGLSGVSARFLTVISAIVEGTTELLGHEPLYRRPMGDIITCLRMLGATIHHSGTEGFLPFSVVGIREPRVHELCISGTTSSQFLSALLLAAPLLERGLSVQVNGDMISKPYVDLTIYSLKQSGIAVAREGYSRFSIVPQCYHPLSLTIEPDASTASYFYALAVLHGIAVEVRGASLSSPQGDNSFLKICSELGAMVTETSEGVTVARSPSNPLRSFNKPLHFEAMPDVAPTFFMIAPFLSTTTRIEGLSTLKIKECDRIECPAAELRKLGVTVRTGKDWIEIDPCTEWNSDESVLIETYDDHRMAMSFGVLGTMVGPFSIADPECVSKTFPDFWRSLDTIKI